MQFAIHPATEPESMAGDAMAKFVESKSLRNMAKKLIAVQDDVSHVDVNEVLFFSELETMGKAAAKCFNLYNHPAQFFTEARFAIVFYESMIDYFTLEYARCCCSKVDRV